MRRNLLIIGGILVGLFVLLGIREEAKAPFTLDAVPASNPERNELGGLGDLEGGGWALVTSLGATINLELAITEADRILGLGGREMLAENTGMLFVFPQSDFYSIWMKGMRFPLDIVWLIENQTNKNSEKKTLVVVDIKENVAPETFPEAFSPKAEALYVLEMNGEAAMKNNIRIGSVLTLERQ